MSFTLCTSHAIVAKAGKNVNAAASVSSALLEQYSDEAEGYVGTITRRDWVGDIAKVPANWLPVLADASSSLAANGLIAYDMGGYAGLAEAEDLININHTRATRAMKALQDLKLQTEMGVS